MPPNLKNNLNINHYDLNNQAKPFGVLPHQSLSNSVNSNSNKANVQQHHHHHSLHEYSTAATTSAINNNELNGHSNHHHHLSKSSCSEPNRHNSQMNKMNQSNNLNLPAMMHQNIMHNNQLNSSSTNNQMINKTTKNQIPHSSAQADQYLLAMNNQQQMLMKQFNHQLANRQSPANHSHNHQNNNSSSNSVITSNNSSSAVNHHMNFKNNFIRSQNNSACLIQNQNLMNKTFNNTYCSMVMGGIQINNYNVSNHNNLIISNQPSSNCTSTNSNVNQAQQMNSFIMNNMNNIQQQIHNNSLLNGGTNSNTSMNNSNSSRCSSVASVNNLQQINESSSCSYSNFNSNSPSFNNNSNNNSSQNNRLSNSNLSSSQHVPTNGQLNKFNNSYTNNNSSFAADNSNNNSNATILSVTPGYYPTPPSSVNRSETLMSQSQHSVQSCSQDDQIMQTQFNQNQFNNGLTSSNYNQKVASNNSVIYLNNQQQQHHNLQTNINDNSSNCLLMNITPVSDTMSEIGKLNDSQCSTNAVNMNLHSQQLDQGNTLQFNSNLNMSLDQQIPNDQVQVQSKKKKEKSKKKKKKLTNSGYTATTAANYYHSQYPNIYSDEFIQQQFNQQNNLISPEEEQLHSNDQQLNNNLSNHLNHSQQQQCLDYDNQTCLVNNQNLNGSNCLNEHEMNLMQQQHHHQNEEQLSNNLLEDKLACLEDDLKYLTESNECMQNFEKDHLSQEKTINYTSDNSNQNGSIDESMLRHPDQAANDQVSLNGSVNGVLMNRSITNESPIGDLNNNNHFEFEESNLDENYVNINLNNRIKNVESSINTNGKLKNSSEDKKLKKKKKKDKSKIKLADKNELINGMNGLKTTPIDTAKLTSSINDLNLPLKNSVDNLDNSILSKKIKIEKKDEYEFTDEFNANDTNDQLQQASSKKRKKMNCENVNKKNKSMNSLNEGLIRSFNSTKDEKSSKKLSNKILTSSSKNKNLNSCETSSNSSCSSNSFNLNSKKENQELLIDRNCLNNQQNGAIISSKSVNMNNQNVVQINNKKIITGKNVNNQLESKKNEVSILNKSDVNNLKQDKKSSSVGSNNSSGKLTCSKLNGTTGKSLSNATKRRSGEKKALTIKEGLGRTGDFVISKDAIEKNQSLLWRIEGKSLLQLFKPVEENGSLFYQNTSSVSNTCLDLYQFAFLNYLLLFRLVFGLESNFKREVCRCRC